MNLSTSIRTRVAAAVLAVAGAGVATPALAEQFDYGFVTTSGTFNVANDGLRNWFSDIYTFAVPTGSQLTLSGSFSTVITGGVASASNLWSDLYVDGGQFVRFAVASTSPVGDAGTSWLKTVTHEPLLLGPGSYGLLVQGLVAGGAPGATASYDGQLSFNVAAPVSEPATLALMAGGIGLVGWAARRKKNAAV